MDRRPEDLSNETFSAIPHYRSAELARRHDPEPRRPGLGRGGNQGKQASVRAAAAVEDALELAALPQFPLGGQSLRRHRTRSLLTGGRDSQPFAAFCAAAFEHGAAVLGRHADEEAVRALAPAAVG
jgi:hypothetical protein